MCKIKPTKYIVKLLTSLTVLSLLTDRIAADDQLLCNNFDRNTKLDGIADLDDGSKLIFKSGHVWQINPLKTYCQRVNITDIFTDNIYRNGFYSINNFAGFQFNTAFGSEHYEKGLIVLKEKHMTGFVRNPKDTRRRYRWAQKDELFYYFTEHEILWKSIDASFIVHNPNFDNFRHFDYFYLIKGQKMYVYGIYFYEHASTQDLSRRVITPIELSDISGKLPANIDSAYCDDQYVYLFKDDLQYRMDVKKFQFPSGFSKKWKIEFKDDEVFVEKQLKGIIEKMKPNLYEQISEKLLYAFVLIKSTIMYIGRPAMFFMFGSIASSTVICTSLLICKLFRKVYAKEVIPLKTVMIL